jgi:Peptidase family S41
MNKIPRWKLTAFSLLISLNLFSQDCSCANDFEYLYNQVMNNYAGSKDRITKDLKQDFGAFTDSIKTASKKADSIQCYYLLKKWVRFFGDYHLGVYLNYKENMRHRFVEQFQKAEFVSIDSLAFDKYLTSNKLDLVEGKWRDEGSNMTFGVIRDRKDKNIFIGFALNKGNGFWMPQQVKFKIKKNGQYKYSTIIYYTSDMEPIKPVATIEERSLHFKGILILRREILNTQQIKAQNYTDRLSPFFEQLNSSTILFKLPSFDLAYKPTIDSIIIANRDLIAGTPNMIIDIRNNNGGYVNCIEKLMPYLYTKPIITEGGEVLATKENIDYFSGIVRDTSYSKEVRDMFQKRVEAMEKGFGNLVKVIKEDTITYDTIYKYPKRVVILVNNGVVSAGELFLLQAKQSSKVQLFGTNSYGAVDYVEVYGYPLLPCKYSGYYFPMIKRFGAKNTPYHNIGIKPDVTIGPHTINWIAYVQEYFKKNQK